MSGMIPLSKPVMDQEMARAAERALFTERLVGGESVRNFEKSFAKYVGTKYAVSTNSGTSALLIALKSLNLEKKDLIAMPSATFIASANSIIHAGGTPLFIDINTGDNTLNARQLRDALEKYGSRIKGIMPVHLYGYPCDMENIVSLSNDYGAPIIEDACQAHGGEFKGKRLGGFGRVSAFSFYTTKNITVGGDGGMIVTNDENIADYSRKLRDQGSLPNSRYKHDLIGYNFRMNTINAAIGYVQLGRLDKWLEKRRSLAKKYFQLLRNIKGLRLPNEDNDSVKSAWHIFAVRTSLRERLSKFLNENGVETGIHYPIPIHRQVPYEGDKALAPFKLTNTERWAVETMSLPFFVEMSDEDVEYVSMQISNFLGQEQK